MVISKLFSTFASEIKKYKLKRKMEYENKFIGKCLIVDNETFSEKSKVKWNLCDLPSDAWYN